MKIAKQAVAFYCIRTGKQWYEFFDNLDKAIATPYEEADDEIWTIKKALEVVLKDLSLQELKANKDEVKSEFDFEGRKNAGEFFTPLVWCAEARKYFDKYIPDWHSYKVWDVSCYDMLTEIYIRRKNTCESDSLNIDIESKSDDYVIGYVTYDNLRDTDEVLSYCTGLYNDWNGERKHGTYVSAEWQSISYRFKRKVKRLITFRVGCNKSDVIRVTPDHKMLIMANDGSGFYIKALSAQQLYESIDGYSIADFYIVSLNTEGTYHLTGGMISVNGEYKDITLNRIISAEPNDSDEDVWDIVLDKYHFFRVRRNGFEFISGNCGSGNLMLESGRNDENVFLSTLQETDVETVKNLKEYKDATVFQLDFLNGIDYDMYNTEFLDKLPERLKNAIVNNEKLIFFANPPYRCGMAKATEVGRYMCGIGMNKSAYDLFYQFCWRIMHFVEMFNLTNVYYCFFGPLTFFTGSSANVLFKEFNKYFEFVDGMCISAQDFSGTSQSIEWGIGCSLWKSKGAYGEEVESPRVLLQKKMLDMDGNVIDGDKTLYTAPREKMSVWLQPKDVFFYKEAPVATSHLTYKGYDEGVLKAKYRGKIAENALGTMMLDSSLARGNSHSAILSLPTSLQFVNITEENFWRCASSFAFRNVYQAGWAETRKWLSAPDTSVEGYDTWLANALVIFLCELKSMQSGVRNIDWCGEKINVFNKLFFISEEEFKSCCQDGMIISDFNEFGFHNQFLLDQIEKVKDLWLPEIKDLFNWSKEMILSTYNARKDYNYKGSLQACDAGMAQLRYGLFSQDATSALFEYLNKARTAVNKDLLRFGFLCDEFDD